MKDWRHYWERFWASYPEKAGESEYLKQVGKTTNGVPISEEQFDTLIGEIEDLLALNEQDDVLDLCCGNGLVTSEIAQRCRSVVGVDFSEALIRRAKDDKQRQNVQYIQMDARRIAELGPAYPGHFSKVLWYEALAFFDTNDLYEILDALRAITTEDVLILIGSVLDAERRWKFFNTWGRRINYIVNIVLLGREVGLGKWWKRQEIEEVCALLGYQCQLRRQNELLHTAHYRVDIMLSMMKGATRPPASPIPA